MTQNQAIHESSRIKLMLVSLAIMMIGITFAFLPVSATTIDVNYHVVVTSRTTVILGPAQNGYIVNAYLNPVGNYLLTIRVTDANNVETNLFTTYVTYANSPFTMPPLTVTIPGTIQVLVTSQGGSSAALSTSLQHSTTTYPLQLPGLALLVAGAAIILTRVYRVKLSVSPSMPVQ